MPDAKFNSKYARNAYADRAARIATLWPITGYRAKQHIDVVYATKKLLSLWRKRIYDLKALEWPDLMTPARLQFVRNCPPSGVYTSQPKGCRYCQLRNLCPWCHMRNVRRVFDTVAAQLPIKLVEISGKMHMDVDSAGEYLDNHFAVWNAMPKRVMKRLRQTQTRLKPLGAFVSTDLSPVSLDAARVSWRFSYCVLVAVPEDWQAPKWLDNGKRRVRITEVTTKKTLVNVVGRVCRYPVGLIRGDPHMVMVSLNARKGKRCSEFTGCFRSGGSRDFNKSGQKASNKTTT